MIAVLEELTAKVHVHKEQSPMTVGTGHKGLKLTTQRPGGGGGLA